MGFSGFLACLQKRSIFLLFVFSLLFLFWIIYRKRKQKRKSRIFAVFAIKRPFLSQIKRWFLAIYRYMGHFHPHPPVFGTRRVGQLSSEFFYFFIFLFFVKYSDFSNSAFLPNFEHFPEHHIYFWFYISFRDIHFRLFSCVMERFMQLCGNFIAIVFWTS